MTFEPQSDTHVTCCEQASDHEARAVFTLKTERVEAAIRRRLAVMSLLKIIWPDMIALQTEEHQAFDDFRESWVAYKNRYVCDQNEGTYYRSNHEGKVVLLFESDKCTVLLADSVLSFNEHLFKRLGVVFRQGCYGNQPAGMVWSYEGR